MPEGIEEKLKTIEALKSDLKPTLNAAMETECLYRYTTFAVHEFDRGASR